MTDVAADAEAADVVARELALLTPAVRRCARALEGELHAEFAEFGASGRRWDRAATVAALAAETLDRPPVTASELTARRLGSDVILVTYRTDAAGRRAWRSSLWRRTEQGWRLYFHQGTLIPPGG